MTKEVETLQFDGLVSLVPLRHLTGVWSGRSVYTLQILAFTRFSLHNGGWYEVIAKKHLDHRTLGVALTQMKIRWSATFNAVSVVTNAVDAMSGISSADIPLMMSSTLNTNSSNRSFTSNWAGTLKKLPAVEKPGQQRKSPVNAC